LPIVSGVDLGMVEFRITGAGGEPSIVATAEPGLLGWAASWDTTGVPDGTYTVTSVAVGSEGEVVSAPVSVVVDN
jgi:hypothetical protein